VRGELGVLGGLGLEFAEAERDRGLDLLREVEVVAGDVREERVDEVQAAQVVAKRCQRWAGDVALGALRGAMRPASLSERLTSSTNSATSRNSL